ncbi:protein of unknown function [Streptomyces sp. KY75]|nr:protein of unknown function [Streptomyces sp. KY70]CAD5988331.1 protein of unknown function [Streptomyces sp. KY75]
MFRSADRGAGKTDLRQVFLPPLSAAPATPADAARHSPHDLERTPGLLGSPLGLSWDFRPHQGAQA